MNYKRRYGLDFNEFWVWICSGRSKQVPPKEKDVYQIYLKLNPFDEILESECQCPGKKFSKQENFQCKHIKKALELLKEGKEYGAEDL